MKTDTDIEMPHSTTLRSSTSVETQAIHLRHSANSQSLDVAEHAASALALLMLVACQANPGATTTLSSSSSSLSSAIEGTVARPQASARRLQRLAVPKGHHLHTMVFSPDGTRLAAGFTTYEPDAWRAEVSVWLTESGQLTLRTALPQGIQRPGALLFNREGNLLVGGLLVESHLPGHTYARLTPSGQVREVCHAAPPGVGRMAWSQQRGVSSLAELADGRVVTGGADDSIALWSATSCEAAWPRGTSCCRSESTVHVGRDVGPGVFLTLGETLWNDEERGGSALGPRRWKGPPWKAEPVPATGDQLLSPGGQLVPRPRPDPGIDTRTSTFAVAHDGSCTAVAAGSVLWVEDVGGGRRWRVDLPAEAEQIAVAARCAAVAASADALWICRAGDCFAR